MLKTFRMKVYKDQFEEYEKRHRQLWPEMRAMLKQHGVCSYTIDLDKETGYLFAQVEVQNEELWDGIAAEPINKKWWAYMEPIMETNADTSPKSVELHRVFEL